MLRRPVHAAVALAFPLLVPAAAFAQSFEAVDTIPWTYGGAFPAYPAAELRPTDVYVQAGVLHDDNVFRRASDKRSETVFRSGLGIRHEQRIVGRQSLRLEARAEQYSFKRFNELNHVAYGLRGEWLWEFTNDLSGTLGYEHRRRLVDLAQLQAPVKDMVTEKHGFATAAYRLGPNVRLRAGLDHVRGDRSESAFEAAEVRATSVIGGVDYVTPLGNAIGIEGRRTRGNAAVAEVVGGTPVDNDFTEREVALVVTWTVSPQLMARGRVGRTSREHEEFSDRDFRGATGRASVEWTPLNKTGFVFSAYREPRTIVDVGASYVVVKGISFGPRWAPTEKLVFSALWRRERQDYSGDATTEVVGGPELEETVRGLRLGVGWEPVRFSEVALGYDTGRRTSNAGGRDFRYHAVMANLRLRF